MRKTTTPLILSSLFLALPASATAKEWFINNGAEFSVNDGVICTINGRIGFNTGTLDPACFDGPGHTIDLIPYATDWEQIAVGDAGRVWGLDGSDNLYVVVNDEPVVFTTLPDSDIRDLEIVGGASLFEINGKDFSIASPMVLTGSGQVWVYGTFIDNDTGEPKGWFELPPKDSDPWLTISTFYSAGDITFPVLLNQSGEIWLYVEGGTMWGKLNDGPLYPNEGFPVPMNAQDGAYNGLPEHNFAFGGKVFIDSKSKEWRTLQTASDPAERYWTPLYNYDDWIQYGADFDGDGEWTDPWFPTHQMFVREVPGAKFGTKLVGGGHGFTNWGFPEERGRVVGFVTNDTGRVSAVTDKPELSPLLAEAWQIIVDSLDFWHSEEQMPPPDQFHLLPSPQPFQYEGPKISYVDPAGGPVYEVGSGYNEVPSNSLPTHELPTFRDHIALDVWVPAESGWVGNIHLSAELHAAQVWDTYLGSIELDPLPRGQWTTLQFDVPEEVKTAMNGDFPGAEVRTFLNTGISGVQIRGLRVAGDPPTAPRGGHYTLRGDVATNAFFEFEDDGDWSGVSMESTSRSSFGNRGIAINTDGWAEIESRQFSTDELPTVSDTMTMDVFVPSPRPSPWWVGNASVYLSCPSISVWGAYVGQVDFGNLFPGEWNTAEISVSPSLQSALTSGASDCSLRLGISTQLLPDTSTKFGLDRLGFLIQ